MKFFFWGSAEVTPSTWQTIILPASFIMICQQLKQNTFWKQIKYNIKYVDVVPFSHSTITQKFLTFCQEAMLCICSLDHGWIYTQNDQFFLSTLVAYAKHMWQRANFPQHRKNSWQLSWTKNLPPSVCQPSKHWCLVCKTLEPWFHLVPSCYLHIQELFTNNSQCDSPLQWDVKPAISLPSCPPSTIGRVPLFSLPLFH